MADYNLGRVQGAGFFNSSAASGTSIALSTISPTGIKPLVGDHVMFNNGDIRRVSAVSSTTVTCGSVLANLKGPQGNPGDKGNPGDPGPSYTLYSGKTPTSASAMRSFLSKVKGPFYIRVGVGGIYYNPQITVDSDDEYYNILLWEGQRIEFGNPVEGMSYVSVLVYSAANFETLRHIYKESGIQIQDMNSNSAYFPLTIYYYNDTKLL